MTRVAADSAPPDRKKLDIEIARLHDLDVGSLRARWHTVFQRKAPPHLSHHLLFRILAYRLQVDQLGDLDITSRRLLERSGDAVTITPLAIDLKRIRPGLAAGTVLAREWNGEMQQVMAQPDGFSWRGKTFRA
jgi:Protein of unknown function (DUF2924)